MAIKAGEVDMGLAFGVEKLAGAGLLAGGSRKSDDNTWTPSGRYGSVAGIDGRIGTEIMPGVFAQIGMEYGHRYGGTSFELFAKISEKNHSHSTLNPLAAYTKKMSLDEIMNDVMIAYPNTRPMCSANCDGAAAAVVVSGSKLKTLSLEQQKRAVKISASILTTDPWEEACQILPNVNDLTRNAAAQAYEQAGVGPSDLNLVELHDCFATAELVHYDNLGLCERGGAADFFNSGATWRDGTTPVNVSGGLESKGHPIAATGIANVWEVATHLRGEAGDRQIRRRQGRPDPRHRPGLGLRHPHPGEVGGLEPRVGPLAVASPVYDTIGRGYVAHRRPDPRWEAVVAEHLGAPTGGLVVNVGAGSGSYEPTHCAVVAMEPSGVMVAQRPPGAAPAVRAGAAGAAAALGVRRRRPGDPDRAPLGRLRPPAWPSCAGSHRGGSSSPSTSRSTPTSGCSTSTYPRSATTPGAAGRRQTTSRRQSGPRRRWRSPCRATCGTASSARTGADRRRTWTRRCGRTPPGWPWPTPPWWPGRSARLEADLASGAWQQAARRPLGRSTRWTWGIGCWSDE